MSEPNLDNQILQELKQLKELVEILNTSKTEYKALLQSLKQLRSDFEAEKAYRTSEFQNWKYEYSNHLQSLNESLENYIRLLPEDNDGHLSDLYVRLDELEKSLTPTLEEIHKLERYQFQNMVFIVILTLMSLLSYTLLFFF